MKFDLYEKVKLNSWAGNIGEIQAYKYETFWYRGQLHESKRYYIKVGLHHFNWYNESELESLDYTFDHKFELDLLDMLIDINLQHGNYDLVKQYNEQKQHLKGGTE